MDVAGKWKKLKFGNKLAIGSIIITVFLFLVGVGLTLVIHHVQTEQSREAQLAMQNWFTEKYGIEAAKRAEELQEKYNVTLLALARAMDIMGESQRETKQDALLAALEAKAKEFGNLKQEIAQYKSDDAKVLKLRGAALAALDKGEFAQAEELFQQAQHTGEAALATREEDTRKLRIATAADAAASGRAARLQSSRRGYENSVRHFAKAAEIAQPADAAQALNYREEQASSLYLLGLEFGDNAALQECIVLRQAILKQIDRDTSPQDWTRIQNNLGNALLNMGKRESGTERLEQAVTAYQEALKEYTRERVPLGWAMTQNNLGNALQTLGKRESGTERLEQAVAAYQEALQERTRERVPLDWAATQNNLGNALETLGERESGTERLEQAVTAYQKALEMFSPEHSPAYHRIAQNNLARVERLIESRNQ